MLLKYAPSSPVSGLRLDGETRPRSTDAQDGGVQSQVDQPPTPAQPEQPHPAEHEARKDSQCTVGGPQAGTHSPKGSPAPSGRLTGVSAAPESTHPSRPCDNSSKMSGPRRAAVSADPGDCLSRAGLLQVCKAPSGPLLPRVVTMEHCRRGEESQAGLTLTAMMAVPPAPPGPSYFICIPHMFPQDHQP